MKGIPMPDGAAVPPQELWEILVPTVRADGRPIHTRFHKVWDGKVRAISGGLTILQPAKGQWVHPEHGTLFAERMIPVRIMCTRHEIEQIIDITLEYYDQLAVMAYRVSDLVILKHRTPKKGKNNA
jgi:hypothetical protein